jgi:hypothetical protein
MGSPPRAFQRNWGVDTDTWDASHRSNNSVPWETTRLLVVPVCTSRMRSGSVSWRFLPMFEKDTGPWWPCCIPNRRDDPRKIAG